MSAPDPSQSHPPLGEGGQQCRRDRRFLRRRVGARRLIAYGHEARARGVRGLQPGAPERTRQPSPRTASQRRGARRPLRPRPGPWNALVSLASLAWLAAPATILAAEWAFIAWGVATLT